MFCKNCGSNLNDTARFCRECGHPTAPLPPPPSASTTGVQAVTIRKKHTALKVIGTVVGSRCMFVQPVFVFHLGRSWLKEGTASSLAPVWVCEGLLLLAGGK
jgi:hypothetical protein